MARLARMCVWADNPSVHLRESDLERYIAGQLSVTRGCALDLHVSECGVCRERLATVTASAATHFRDSRIERRLKPLTGLVRVLQPLSPIRLEARVVAKTGASMRLQIPESIEPGALLQVRLKDAIVLAEARYCVQAMAQFLVGVRIRNVFPRP